MNRLMATSFTVPGRRLVHAAHRSLQAASSAPPSRAAWRSERLASRSSDRAHCTPSAISSIIDGISAIAHAMPPAVLVCQRRAGYWDRRRASGRRRWRRAGVGAVAGRARCGPRPRRAAPLSDRTAVVVRPVSTVPNVMAGVSQIKQSRWTWWVADHATRLMALGSWRTKPKLLRRELQRFHGRRLRRGQGVCAASSWMRDLSSWRGAAAGR